MVDNFAILQDGKCMPLYEYACVCGETFEALDPVGQERILCGEYCKKPGDPSCAHQGQVRRILSATHVRGDGREAKESTFNPAKRANRPYNDCHDCSCEGN